MVVAKGLGGRREYCLMGMEFQFGEMMDVLEKRGGSSDSLLNNANVLNATELYSQE